MTRKRLVAIAWTAAIVIACSIPGNDLPKVEVDYVDKAAHFALFFVFGWLWMRSKTDTSRHWLVRVSTAGLLLAGGTEIYQGLLPINRSADLLDAVANGAGLLAGIGTFAVYERIWGNEPADSVS